MATHNENDINLHQEKLKLIDIKLDTKLNKEEVLVFKRQIQTIPTCEVFEKTTAETRSMITNFDEKLIN